LSHQEELLLLYVVNRYENSFVMGTCVNFHLLIRRSHLLLELSVSCMRLEGIQVHCFFHVTFFSACFCEKNLGYDSHKSTNYNCASLVCVCVCVCMDRGYKWIHIYHDPSSDNF
jgi:hypothetical protein